MNKNRIYKSNGIKKSHGTYIMTKSFRVLDNHSLFYLINNYDTHNIVILRKPKNIQRHDELFSDLSKDLVKTLSKITDVCISTSMSDTTNKIKGDIVLDKAYLKEDLLIENELINLATFKDRGFTVIESNITVPVTITSNKEEYSARTIRNKIFKQLHDFIDPVNESLPKTNYEERVLRDFLAFIENKLPYYHLKNHPELNYTSDLSVSLKYGIISPIRLYLLLEQITHENKTSFLDELIIRRELAYNFVFFNQNYDKFNHMTYSWAYQTMRLHQYDLRQYIYSVEDYINFRTHDPYFNAAMKEMVYLGKMHGYLRMYWCKKIIEWSPTYQEAYDIAIYLNNHYFLDGDTPNGYAGVAWCFGKHDRAWTEREIFGKLRYMNLNGLKRKFDIDLYVTKINEEVQVYESKQT